MYLGSCSRCVHCVKGSGILFLAIEAQGVCGSNFNFKIDHVFISMCVCNNIKMLLVEASCSGRVLGTSEVATKIRQALVLETGVFIAALEKCKYM